VFLMATDMVQAIREKRFSATEAFDAHVQQIA
jgi:hypothetical protein